MFLQVHDFECRTHHRTSGQEDATLVDLAKDVMLAEVETKVQFVGLQLILIDQRILLHFLHQLPMFHINETFMGETMNASGLFLEEQVNVL